MKQSTVIVIVVILSAVGLMFLPRVFDGNLTENKEEITIEEGVDHVKGSVDASVVLIEYSDFQCPACKSYYPLVRQLASEYNDRLLVVYRHFPLREVHARATIAAYATEAAGKQGKFWEMHDVIFENQDNWVKAEKPEELFATYAGVIALDVEQFLKDYDAPETKTRVNRDAEDGRSKGINSTPTFYINGVKITNNPRSMEEFRTLIEKTLTAKGGETRGATSSPVVSP